MRHDYDSAVCRLYGPEATWEQLTADERAEVEHEIDAVDEEDADK